MRHWPDVLSSSSLSKPSGKKRKLALTICVALSVLVGVVLLILGLTTDTLEKGQQADAPTPISPQDEFLDADEAVLAGQPAGAAAPCARSHQWTQLGNTTFALGETAAGVLTLDKQSYILLVGETGPDLDPAFVGKSLLYSVDSGNWSVAAARPYAGNHHAAEVIDNEMYVFGGLTSSSEDKVQIGALKAVGGAVDVVWREGTPLPAGRGSTNTALIDGKVYLCGGIATAPDFDGNPADLETSEGCWVYTPSAAGGTWDGNVTDMPLGRNHAASCSDGERFYVFGGRTGGNEILPGFNDTQIFDPATNLWTASNGTSGTPANLPGPGRGGMGKAAFHDGKCYVFGGESFDEPDPTVGLTARNVFNRVDIFHIANNSWSAGQALPFGLHGIFPVKVGCDIHITGGGVKVAFSQGQAHMKYSI